VTLHDLGRLDEARAELPPAVAELTRLYGPEHPRMLRLRGRLAALWHDLGQRAEAVAECDLALRSSASLLGEDHPVTTELMAVRATMTGEGLLPLL
jgi:hypothetical protein